MIFGLIKHKIALTPEEMKVLSEQYKLIESGKKVKTLTNQDMEIAFKSVNGVVVSFSNFFSADPISDTKFLSDYAMFLIEQDVMNEFRSKDRQYLIDVAAALLRNSLIYQKLKNHPIHNLANLELKVDGVSDILVYLYRIG